MKIDGSGNGVEKSAIQGSQASPAIAGIQKQIQRVRQEIAKLSENETMPTEDKQKRKKELEDQINSLNKQLTQCQMEEKKVEQERRAQEIQQKMEEKAQMREKEEEKPGLDLSSVQAIIAASTSMEQAKTVNHVRTQMTSNAHMLQGNIAAEEARGGDSSKLKSQLNELEGQIGEVTSQLLNKYGEANKTMQSAVETEKNKEATDKEEELKSEELQEQKEKQEKESKQIDVKI